MAFPHPQSRKDHDRNKDKASREGVLRNRVERTVDVSEDRNAEDDVNPAEDRTCEASARDVGIRCCGHDVAP